MHIQQLSEYRKSEALIKNAGFNKYRSFEDIFKGKSKMEQIYNICDWSKGPEAQAPACPQQAQEDHLAILQKQDDDAQQLPTKDICGTGPAQNKLWRS
uniref:Uncharacterized protein n=1 Tax=Romanomermis culicivorax TaxID=13658 RepID=A0A915IBI5_ROMCU